MAIQYSRYFHKEIKLFNFVEMNDRIDREIYETYYIALLSPIYNKDKTSFRRDSINYESYNELEDRIKRSNIKLELNRKFEYSMIISISALLIFYIFKLNLLAIWGVAIILISFIISLRDMQLIKYISNQLI